MAGQNTESNEETPKKPKAVTPRRRAEHFSEVSEGLSGVERFNINFIKRTFENERFNDILRLMQRYIGAGWIWHCTKNLIHIHGLENLPAPSKKQPFIWVANHRSFFDMFVANAMLFRHGYHERVLYPVRSKFFYDHPLGFLLNGVMSFWSMYPPIFRERSRASLTHTSFSELAHAIKRGRSVGIHPEGTRKQDDDPYTFLPAQSGVGRLIHLADAQVVPIFINGLSNNFWHQIVSNFRRNGPPHHPSLRKTNKILMNIDKRLVPEKHIKRLQNV